MNAHVTEVLVSMGVGDRIVGRSFAEREPLPALKEQVDKIPVLADQYPTYEQLLDVDPDFVVAGMSSAFSEKEGRSRERLAEAGIKTFKFSEYCGKGFSDLDMLAADYRQLGEILGASAGAERVIDSVTIPMKKIQEQVSGATPVKVFVYDSGIDAPMTIGGVGAGHLAVTTAGGKNIFDEGEKPFPKTTWEVVAERSPEWIVILDYGKKSAQQKIADLKAQPLASTTPAVKKNNFIIVPLSDLFESPRIVTSTQKIAKAIHPDRVQ